MLALRGPVDERAELRRGPGLGPATAGGSVPRVWWLYPDGGVRREQVAQEVADADFDFVFQCVIEGRPIPIPENSDRGNHARDAATINWYCDRAAAIGRKVRSVRAIFEEGEPIFESSKIRSRAHVQVAVRDLMAIVEIEEAPS